MNLYKTPFNCKDILIMDNTNNINVQLIQKDIQIGFLFEFINEIVKENKKLKEKIESLESQIKHTIKSTNRK